MDIQIEEKNTIPIYLPEHSDSPSHKQSLLKLKIVLGIIFILSLGVAIVCVIITYLYPPPSSCNQNLRLWVFLFGQAQYFTTLSILFLIAKLIIESGVPGYKIWTFITLQLVFLFIWLIIGSIWTSQANKSLCDSTLYLISYILTIVGWIGFGILSIMIGGLCLLNVCFSSFVSNVLRH